MKTTADDQELSFETAMDRLENLVEQMESAQLPLSDLITRYEEGNRLLKLCAQQLEEAEKRVQMVVKGSSDKPQIVPFEKVEAPEPVTAPAKPTRGSSRTSEALDDEISLF